MRNLFLVIAMIYLLTACGSGPKAQKPRVVYPSTAEGRQQQFEDAVAQAAGAKDAESYREELKRKEEENTKKIIELSTINTPEQQEAINSVNRSPDSISGLISSISKLKNAKQGEFEQKQDYLKRKKLLASRIDTDKMYSVELERAEAKYNPDKEMWIIRPGVLSKLMHDSWRSPLDIEIRHYADDPAYVLRDNVEIIIRESISNIDLYEASNAMGATVTVREFKGVIEGIYVSSRDFKMKFKEYYKYNSLELPLPMPIDMASSFGSDPDFKYRLVFKLDGYAGDPSFLYSGHKSREAKITSAVSFDIKKDMPRAIPIALVVYHITDGPTILWQYGF